MRALCVLLLPLLAAALPAQVDRDDFNRPNSTNLGKTFMGNAWTEAKGDWTISSLTAAAQPRFLWQYATIPVSLRDVVVQCLVIKNTGVSHTLQFGGVALRVNNPSAGSLGRDLVMVKVQNNSFTTNPNAFDSIWLYEINASGVSSATARTGITPTFAKAVVRLSTIGKRVVAEVDSDLDGIWNYTLTRTLGMTVKPGPVALDGFGGVKCDDFKLWDAVVLRSTTSLPPRPGNAVDYVLQGPVPLTPYLAACSLGNGGIPLPDGRIIPLSPDGLFFVSALGLDGGTIFVNFRGALDNTGAGQCQVRLPNLPALVGVTYYLAFITYSTSGILSISADHQTTIIS